VMTLPLPLAEHQQPLQLLLQDKYLYDIERIILH